MAIKHTYVYGNSICLIRNKYPIKGTIIPQHRLTSTQIDDVLTNVKYNLLNNLNSRKINFGEEMDYDTVYSLIVNSDERIKSIMMDDITYKTYVTYLYIDEDDKPHFLDIRIDAKEGQLHTVEDLKLGYVLTSTPDSGFSLNESVFKEKTNYAHGTFSFVKEDNQWNLSIQQELYDIDDVNGSLNGVSFKDIIMPNYGITIPQGSDVSSISITVKGFYDAPYKVYEDREYEGVEPSYIEFPSLYDYLRALILTKSILAGKTPYFLTDNSVPSQTLNQKYLADPNEKFRRIDSVTNLSLSGTLSTQQNPPTNSVVFNVDPHTTVEFTSPNLIDTDEYSSYVKYEYHINHDIPANSNYKLGAAENNTQSDEYIAFYWGADEDSGNNYAVYGAGTIIQPTFPITSNSLATSTLPNILNTKLQEALSEGKNYVTGVTYLLPDNTVDLHIDELETQGSVLSSTKRVTIKKQNIVELNDSMYCSWHLNDATDGYFILFDVNEDERILKNNEYFMYTNQSKSSLVILGQGTKITRRPISESDWQSVWQCKEFDYSEIVSDGLEALVKNIGSLVNIPSGQTVSVTEMQYVAVPPGGAIKITSIGQGALPDHVDINGTIMATPVGAQTEEEYKFKASDCILSYNLDGGSEYINIPLSISKASGADSMDWNLYCYGVIDMGVNSRFILGNTQTLNGKITEALATSSVDFSIIGSDTPYVVSNKAIRGDGNVTVNKASLVCYNIIINQFAPGREESKIVFTDSGFEMNCVVDTSEYEGMTLATNEIEIETIPGNYVMRADLSSFNAVSNVFWEVSVYTLENNEWEDKGRKFICYYGSCTPIFYNIESVNDDLSSRVKISISLKTLSTQLPEKSTYTLPIAAYRMYKINSYVDAITGTFSENGVNTTIESIINLLRNRCVSEKFNFDYSYVVDNNEIVRYPLVPSSFFDKNHVYNSFTIAQYDIDTFYSASDGLFVTTKVK